MELCIDAVELFSCDPSHMRQHRFPLTHVLWLDPMFSSQYDDGTIADCILKQFQEEKEHEAYLKRRALAAKWEAEKAAKELQVQREQDLQWFQSSLDTTKVAGGFLFEMWVKALPLSSPQTAKESRHKRKSKAEEKNTARFL